MMHALLFTAFLAFPTAVDEFSYRQPPAPIARILDAAPLPFVSVSPSGRHLLFAERRAMPTIAEVARPALGLAGTRIDAPTNGPAFARSTFFRELVLLDLATGKERLIGMPPSDRIGTPQWSRTGEAFAFTVTTDAGIQLWVADVATAQARSVTPPVVNAAFVNRPFRWLASGRELICSVVVRDRGTAPVAPDAPHGPIVQESDGKAAASWTYTDVLTSPEKEAQFEYYARSQLAWIDLAGKLTLLAEPALITEFAPSPDGNYVLVASVHRPYSRVEPLSAFPARTVILDRSGKVVRELADTSLQEIPPLPPDRVGLGPRAVQWKADADATLTWVEAIDGGDPMRAADARDRVFTLTAPFDAQPTKLVDLAWRLGSIVALRDDLAFVTESWWTTRRTRTWAIEPGRPDVAPRLVFERSSQDAYADPGSILTRVSSRGTPVAWTSGDGKYAYLAGRGASQDGEFPFLDRLDLSNWARERLWRCEAPYFEEVTDLLDANASAFLTRRESVTEPPNVLRRTSEGKFEVITGLKDQAPEFAKVVPELITYARKDGVNLSATLLLPPGYDPASGPIPFVFWAYPTEFKDKAAAGQVRGSPYRFTRPNGGSRDHLFLLTQGFGILDDPKMPIIGEGDRQPNDTYIEQLVASAEAAVDAVVARGVAERGRIAIGGHSYGAFMTANLLAHSNLFATGIARSGAYNRTLTPFGFQAEPRSFWDAPETYIAMSPFTFAHRIDEPILLIHGQNDSNSGTFPIQTERLFAAIKGNGGKARYVQLPFEDHGYRARESVGHVQWEMCTWLEAQLKSKSAPRDG
ncbi:MAG: S9 family peptidase [Planctomycetes bacterium]|nr:S9 family peptidase [Planctomycetota bacterium]